MTTQSSNSSSFVYLDQFDLNTTGYTNEYLKNRNDLKSYHLSKDDRMMSESKTDPNFVYSIFKDLDSTPVTNLFFSRKNIDYVQYMLKYLVYKETGNIIGRQSDEELLIIMRSIYLSDSKAMPDHIPQQVAELNAKVIKYAVYQQILPKVTGYVTFLNDNFRTNVVLPQAKNVNMRGARINRGTADLI